MFGYIRAYTPELRVREEAYYKAAYCGLCRSMGKCTGQCSRMALSYDFTFLFLLRSLLTDDAPEIKKGRCTVHPLSRRPYLVPNAVSSYIASVSAMLTYGKVKDDLADERGLRRLRAILFCPFAAAAYRKARKRYPDLASDIEEKLNALNAEEKNSSPSPDTLASLFGEIGALFLAYGLEGERQTLAAHLGKHIGKWLYLADAADDFAADATRGRFNPFATLFSAPPTDEQKSEAASAMLMELEDAVSALDLLPASGNQETREIVRNILLLGMPEVQTRIFNQTANEKRKQRL